MTITTNPSRNEYTSTTSQTVFNYTFKIYEDSDLNVYVTPQGQGADDVADIVTAYTVDPATIGNEDGGFITFTAPQSAGDAITIVSNIPESRTTDYQFNGDFQADTVNADFDRTVSLVKQNSGALDRIVGFPESQQGVSDVNLTLPSPDAGKALIWNDTEDGLDNSSSTFDSILPGATAAAAAAAASAVNAASSESAAASSASSAATSATLAESFSDMGLNAGDLFDFGLVTVAPVSFPTDFGSIV